MSELTLVLTHRDTFFAKRMLYIIMYTLYILYIYFVAVYIYNVVCIYVDFKQLTKFDNILSISCVTKFSLEPVKVIIVKVIIADKKFKQKNESKLLMQIPTFIVSIYDYYWP